MEHNLLNIGFGNMVVSGRVVAIVAPSSAPMKRLKDDAREGGGAWSMQLMAGAPVLLLLRIVTMSFCPLFRQRRLPRGLCRGLI